MSALVAEEEDAALAARMQALLARVFGHARFRGPQAEIVAHVARGGDALVLETPGGGGWGSPGSPPIGDPPGGGPF